VAELAYSVLHDDKLRAAVIATQERAIARIRGTDFGALLADRLAPVLGSQVPAAASAPAP
jgi:hypothetical protein